MELASSRPSILPKDSTIKLLKPTLERHTFPCCYHSTSYACEVGGTLSPMGVLIPFKMIDVSHLTFPYCSLPPSMYLTLSSHTHLPSQSILHLFTKLQTNHYSNSTQKRL